MSPKTFRRLDDNLNVGISSDMKREIRALSHVQGDAGRISHTVRRMLFNHLRDMKYDWGQNKPDVLAEFNAVLENLYTAEKIKAGQIIDELEAEELSE